MSGTGPTELLNVATDTVKTHSRPCLTDAGRVTILASVDPVCVICGKVGFVATASEATSHYRCKGFRRSWQETVRPTAKEYQLATIVEAQPAK